MNLKLTSRARALVIVAHPDDETIWMGGTILGNPQADWTIFSLCRASDADRAPKFARACDRYGAKPIITDLEDEDKLGIKKSAQEAKNLILKNIAPRKFDYIFTHGQNGEYGHPKHKAVYLAVWELINKKKILPKAVFYFNYKKAAASRRPSMEAKKDSDILVPLSKAVFKEKKRIQAEIHGYAPDGIDVGLCTNPEAFKLTVNN